MLNFGLRGRAKKAFELRRQQHFVLPYGMWTCADGSQVLFNRYYQPIFARKNEKSPAFKMAPNIGIPWVKQEWFFGDGNPPWKNKSSLKLCEDMLYEWGANNQDELISINTVHGASRTMLIDSNLETLSLFGSAQSFCYSPAN